MITGTRAIQDEKYIYTFCKHESNDLCMDVALGHSYLKHAGVRALGGFFHPYLSLVGLHFLEKLGTPTSDSKRLSASPHQAELSSRAPLPNPLLNGRCRPWSREKRAWGSRAGRRGRDGTGRTLVFAKLTVSARGHGFRGPHVRSGNSPAVIGSSSRLGKGLSVPHHREGRGDRAHQNSGNANLPSRVAQPRLVAFLDAIPRLLLFLIPPWVQPRREVWCPTLAGCARRPEKPQRRQARLQTRRAATCFTKPGVCCGGELRREEPCQPLGPPRHSISKNAHHPQTKCAHTFAQPERLASLFPTARGDLLPDPQASAPTPALASGPRPRPTPPPGTAPQNTCREDAESEEGLADHGTLVLGAEPGAGGGRVCRD